MAKGNRAGGKITVFKGIKNSATTTQQVAPLKNVKYSLILSYVSLLLPKECFIGKSFSSIKTGLTSLKHTDEEEYSIYDNIYPEQ